MKILIFNWRDIKNPKKGGAEIILYELCKRLISQNHSVSWFSYRFKNSLANENFEGIKIIRQGNQLSVFLKAFMYYRSLIEKPDIVLDCVNTICWQTPLYVESSRRRLYANQSARKIFFYEYLFPFSLLGFIFEPLQYFSYKNTKTFCYSNSIKQDLISFGISKSKIDVFPLGIDHRRYKPEKKSSVPTFIFVARFVKNKRGDICILSMKIVTEKHPTAKLYMIGYGAEEQAFKKIIKIHALENNVIICNKDNVFLQSNKKDMKVRFMQSAWALLLPSVKEGWGMVVTEAGACGTPSIVSNVTGLQDSVIHDKTGIILSSNPNPEEMSSAMMQIIEKRKLRDQLSAEAKKFSSQFSWEKSYKTFYKYLMDN